MIRTGSILLGLLLLAGCGDREARLQAEAAARAAEQERKAEQLAGEYERAVTAQNWDLARVHGGALLSQYPQSQAAQRVGPGYEEVKAKGEAEREQRRLAALWNYSQVAVKGGTQRSAMIYSREPVDVDGTGPKPVQLVFRDHPEWKRSSYLVLQSGDFRCGGGCRVQVKADDAAPRAMAAWRPDTDEAIAMFITDDRAVWRLLRKTRVVEIEFPVKAGGTRKAVFETGGLDGSQMPGWD